VADHHVPDEVLVGSGPTRRTVVVVARDLVLRGQTVTLRPLSVADAEALPIGSTWLAASAQRTRCNSEAKWLLLSHAFEVWQVYRVSLETDARNDKSRRAIERLGALFEGIRRGWPIVRKNLETALAR
jgi:hypothetical protein